MVLAVLWPRYTQDTVDSECSRPRDFTLPQHQSRRPHMFGLAPGPFSRCKITSLFANAPVESHHIESAVA